MKELVLASNNQHKINEIKEILTEYKIYSLRDVGFHDDIVEDGSSFEENALIKARVIAKHTGKLSIADDSGLCIELLNGEPGIFSARYSQEQTDEKNIEKVLSKLNGETSPAYFVSVIALVSPDGLEKTFRGEVHGEILTEKRGNNGFGYDPIFYVKKFSKTFAELTNSEKNSISHRKYSLEKLVSYLREHNNEN